MRVSSSSTMAVIASADTGRSLQHIATRVLPHPFRERRKKSPRAKKSQCKGRLCLSHRQADQSFQNPSKRSERSSVYRTVCMMLRWPRKCCSARRDQDCGRVAVGRTGNACGQHPGDGRLPSGLGIPAPADRRSAVGVLRRQWFNDRNGLSMSPERTRPGDLWQSGQFPHRSLRVDNSEMSRHQRAGRDGAW